MQKTDLIAKAARVTQKCTEAGQNRFFDLSIFFVHLGRLWWESETLMIMWDSSAIVVSARQGKWLQFTICLKQGIWPHFSSPCSYSEWHWGKSDGRQNQGIWAISFQTLPLFASAPFRGGGGSQVACFPSVPCFACVSLSFGAFLCKNLRAWALNTKYIYIYACCEVRFWTNFCHFES